MTLSACNDQHPPSWDGSCFETRRNDRVRRERFDKIDVCCALINNYQNRKLFFEKLQFEL